MANKPWFTANVHAPGTGVALVLIAITLLPVAAVAFGQLICFSEGYINDYVSKPWTPERIRYCNGG